MSATGNGIKIDNYNVITRGYIFKSLWDIKYKEEMKTFDDLENFLVCYARQAYVDKMSCVISNEEDEILFYMEKGVIIYAGGREDDYEKYMQLIVEG